VHGIAVVSSLEEDSMSLQRGLALSPSEVLDGLPHDEQLRVIAGKYDQRFPALRAAYVSALVDEMARLILANERIFQHCADRPRAEEKSWHLVEDSGTIH
jgi:hypothetical protein